MTSEEFLKSKEPNIHVIPKEYLEQYARLKCEELLEIVVNKARVTTIWEGNTGSEYVDYDVNKDSILNAVDLEKFCAGTAFS